MTERTQIRTTNTGNKTLKQKHWKPKYWHETANDGGAIYCSNEAEMNIINNVFINNQHRINSASIFNFFKISH